MQCEGEDTDCESRDEHKELRMEEDTLTTRVIFNYNR